MNLGQMITFSTLTLGNMQTSDPYYSVVTDCINDAANDIVMHALGKTNQNADLFPELMTTWKDVTTADVGYMALPTNCLYPTAVGSFDKTGSDPNNDRIVMWLKYEDPKRFDLLNKATTQTGKPRIFTRKGNRIYIWPTPRTADLTDLRIMGISKETTLSSNADSFVMDARWHRAVCWRACYLVALAMNWIERASSYALEADKEIALAIDPTAGLRSAQDRPVRIFNEPTRAKVYSES